MIAGMRLNLIFFSDKGVKGAAPEATPVKKLDNLFFIEEPKNTSVTESKYIFVDYWTQVSSSRGFWRFNPFVYVEVFCKLSAEMEELCWVDMTYMPDVGELFLKTRPKQEIR